MKTLFDIEKFNSYKEDNRREVKKAKGGLPNDTVDRPIPVQFRRMVG